MSARIVDKRTAILETAITCIAKYGIERTSTPVIARELGIAQSGVFYHFESQQELFDSLLVHIVAGNHRIVEQLRERTRPRTAFEGLLAYVRGNLYWAQRERYHVGVLLYSYMKTSYSRTMRRTVADVMAFGENTVYGHLATGVAEKQLTVEGDLRAMAKFLHQALIGAIIAFHYGRPAETYLQVYDRLARHFAQLLDQPLPRRSGAGSRQRGISR